MRVSSKGNPYHDEKGRFTSPNRSVATSQKKACEYNKQTSERGHKVLFQAKTPRGYHVIFNVSSMLHTKKNHAIMVSKVNQKAIKEVLKNPEKVYRSAEFPNREVFFGKSEKATFGTKYYIKVIVQRDGKNGVVKTVFNPVKIGGNIGELLYGEEDSQL